MEHFALLFAPFKSRSAAHAAFYDKKKISVPSLVVIGDDDKVIERPMSDDVLPMFEDVTVVRHSGGHYVPAGAEEKKLYTKFMQKVLKMNV